MSVASKGVQKRPKSSRGAHSTQHASRTSPKHATPAAKRRPSRNTNKSPPTTPMTPEDADLKDPKEVRGDVRLSAYAPPQNGTLPSVSPVLTGTYGGLSGAQPPAPNRTIPELVTTSYTRHQPQAGFPAPQRPSSYGAHSADGSGFAPAHPNAQQAPALSAPSSIAAMQPPYSSASMSLPTTPSHLMSSQLGKSQPPAPAAMPLPYGSPDGHTLPAPSTLLADKRLQSGGGRPPVIPVSLPKHFLGYQAPKEPASGPKAPFDLRVPSSPVTSGSKSLMFGNKMPKIPITMELDDSDDEGPSKIVGAQDAFVRTGNPFGGFAPPARCSPLPVSSPIVCPGISPMPLSPLAPFSPLPHDSPANHAPNPVHPPVHTPTVRPNTNW
ncbi:hypothetical protein FGB62_79g026 [Gracilaria domingensis]|nr:hypothetical protein FGB62_79g026 [Gracilaria domingensis]